MSTRLSIICENTVGRPIPAIGEHGFSCLVEHQGGCWLFDTGQGHSLLHNLDVLAIDSSRIEGVILSHGHYDHAGGLLELLKKVGPRPVYAHPDIFLERYWQGQHERRSIGVPHSRAVLEAAGAEFHFYQDFTTIAQGLHFSGKIPRITAAETGDAHLVTPGAEPGSWVPDAFADDAALAIETPRGLVVLLGCAHAGLINTVRHFLDKLDQPHIYAIVGGTHLGPASDAQFTETLDFLEEIKVEKLGLSHCTGQIRAAQVHARFPNKVFFAAVGSSLEV
ncbi:MAG: MBL fold metallo-hydrolase [Desulfuromonadales bacterium]|nr:MBL fold metallo-hydrolase [Desulfuromonadales bacterium]